jgi:hypothetical protein
VEVGAGMGELGKCLGLPEGNVTDLRYPLKQMTKIFLVTHALQRVMNAFMKKMKNLEMNLVKGFDNF